jgi:putative ABC transport system permease protein
MKNTTKAHPPRWATKVLRWYCRRELLEDLEGDLHEYFTRNVQQHGAGRARLIYIIDVLKFFRPYTIQRPGFLKLLTHWIMLGSYIRTSGRSIARNKLFSVINIAGLAISMSVGLLIIAMMSDLLSYDRFHQKHDRIYRVISQYEYNGKKDEDIQATTSLKAAKAIKESFPGVEDVAILKRDFGGDVTADETTIPLSGFWANDSFFKVFSFQLLQGNARTALKEPFTIVLTEKSALKLFGHTDVLGKVVKMRQGEHERAYTISGLMKDIPVFSHIKFEILGSLSTREVTEAGNDREMAWDNVWGTWAYVLLEDKRAAPAFVKNLVRLSEKEDKSAKLTHIALDLQPLDDIVTGRNLSNPIGQTMGATVMWIFSAMAFIVILCAGLNYTNLSIARSIRRSREVGIRKTIGAQKSHVVNQFLVESLIISMLALVAGFGLFLLIKPHFLSIESSLRELLVLDFTPRLVLMFVLFAIIVGLAAGIFPAIFFSRINAVQALKNLSAIPMLKGVTVRQALIVFQYSVSIIAISTTLIMHKQYRHFIAYDLGFTTENILNIRLQGNKPELLKKALLELPEVMGVSQSLMITSIGEFYGTLMKNPKEPQDSAGVHFNAIDEHYLPLHDHKLLAGENFKGRGSKAPESEVIVNEQVLKRFDIAERKPEKAIGEIVTVEGQDLTIIGVMKDFQYGRANNRSGNTVIMRYAPEQAQYLNVKILSSDWPETYEKIESIWKQFDKVHPLEARFYDEQIEAGFDGLKASMKVGSFVAFLVIAIASIGLLGMVVYSTETRIREVSIRKVFGATELRLLYLLSKGFLVLVIIAACFSLPVTYLVFDRVLLPELANHAPLGLFEMSAGVISVIAIALLMIGSQTVKVIGTNPAEVLKVE